MSYKISFSSYFVSEAKKLKKRYHSFLSDLENFKKSIEENPFQGTELSPGIRKIRMVISSKGKGLSGGARVITYNVLTSEKDGRIIFLLIYDKSDADTIKMNVVKKIIQDLNL